MNFIPWMVWPITTDLRHLSLTANCSLYEPDVERSSDRDYLLDSNDDFRSGCRTVVTTTDKCPSRDYAHPDDQTIPSRILYHCFSYVRYDVGLCSLISTAPLGTIQYSVFKAIPVLLLLLSCLLSLSGQRSTRLSRLHWRHLWTFFFTSLISRHLWSAAMTTQS